MVKKVKKELVNAQEACKILKCSKSKLYKLTHNREIRYSKYGGKVWFRMEDLTAYIESRTIEIKSNDELAKAAHDFIDKGDSYV